eukprot:589937-Prorocentrum_minimum.AAC.1
MPPPLTRLVHVDSICHFPRSARVRPHPPHPPAVKWHLEGVTNSDSRLVRFFRARNYLGERLISPVVE